MNILQKFQNQPEKVRKAILWLVVIIAGLILFIFWLKNAQEKIKNFQKEGLGLPSLKEQIEGMPKIEMPETSEEELGGILEQSEK